MNQKQRDYALARADAIAKNRINAVEIDHRVPGHKLSLAELELALKGGHFMIRPVEDWGSEYKRYGAKSTGLGSVLKFDMESEPSVLPGLDEKVAAIKARHQQVRDNIMLGDDATAMALLDTFGTEEIAA